MVTADLYIRVSTDEQAEKGYSQRDQDERLRKYCFHNNITVGQVQSQRRRCLPDDQPATEKWHQSPSHRAAIGYGHSRK